MSEEKVLSEPIEAWSPGRTYMIGALGGLLVGALAAYLYVRSANEHNTAPPKVKTSEAIKLAVAVITLMRQIAALSAEKEA
jgi:hypothetical protein